MPSNDLCDFGPKVRLNHRFTDRLANTSEAFSQQMSGELGRRSLAAFTLFLDLLRFLLVDFYEIVARLAVRFQ